MKSFKILLVSLLIFSLIIQISTLNYSAKENTGESSSTDLNEIKIDQSKSLFSLPNQNSFTPILEKVNSQLSIENSSINLPQVTLLFSSLFESLGEESTDTGSLTIGSDDTILIGGSTTSKNIQMLNAYDYNYNGGSTDAFFSQFLSNGKLYKSTYFGGNGNEVITNIAIDSNNNIIIAGTTDSTDLPYTENSYDFVFNGYTDIFLSKFTYNGNLIWSTYFGGSYTDSISDLALDSNDNIYIIGSTDSTNFPSFNMSVYGENDAFVAKFSSNGLLLNSRFIGGSGNDFATDLRIEDSSLYISGSTSSTDFSFLGTTNNSIHGNMDSFVVSFDLDLNQLTDEFLYGGNGFETNSRIDFDGTNLILAGISNSTDSPSTLDFSKVTNLNNTSIFFNKLSLTSKSIIWSRFIGGSNFDFLTDLKTSPNGIITLSGKSNSSTSFPIRNAYDNEYSGGFDGFIMQFDTEGKIITSSYLGGSANDEIDSIAYDSSGDLYLSGMTLGDFPQTMSNSYLNTSEIFLTKFSQISDPYVVNRFGSYCNSNNGSCKGEFNELNGITIGSDDNLYVVDSLNNGVQVLDQNGNFIRKFGLPGSENGNFNYPNDIAIRSDDKIFISDVNNQRIQIFYPNGDYYGFISSVNGSSLTKPIGLAFNETDYLFVTDAVNYGVYIFYPNLTFLKQFGGEGTSNGKFIAIGGIDVKNGFIYVSDSGLHRIQVFDLNGNYIRQWGKSGSNIGEFNKVNQLYASNNFLYTVDMYNHRIQIFTLNGAFVTTIVGSTDNKQNQFKFPLGITVNSSGYIYLANAYFHNIIVFKPISISNSLTINLDYIPKYSYEGQGISIDDNPPNLPSGFDITYNGTTRYLYVIDNATDSIKKFSFEDFSYGVNSTYIDSFGTSGSGINEFNHSSDIAINETNYIYITDTNNNRVVIYNSTDQFFNLFGQEGSGNGSFNKPIGIAISKFNHYIYVVDSGNNRIQYFDWNGSYINKWGSFGIADGQFNHPYGIAIDSKDGNVFISDQNNNRIQVFNSTGSFLFTFGQEGNLAGEFNHPGHIAIDSTSYVYITDIGNARIQVFDKNGTYKTFENGINPDNKPGSINGITIDSNDNLYFNDYYNLENYYSTIYILKYVRSSSYLTKIGNPYYTFSPQNVVFSLAVDPYGKTISAGLMNNSIVNYDISTQKSIPSSVEHKNPVTSIDYSSNGLLLASGGLDNVIFLTSQNGLTRKLVGHNGPINSVKFFENNKFLASASADKTIKIWNVSDGTLISTLKNHTAGILDIAISPDNKILISGSLDNTIKIWNLSTYSLIKTLTGHTNYVSGLAYSPNGNYFVSVSFDKTVIVWDANTFNQLGRIIRHTGKIYSVAFNPDSTEFATGDNTGMIYVWNVNTRKTSWQLNDHTGIVYALKYSPGGSFLISGGADKKIKVWSISSQIENDLDRDGMNDYWEAIHGLSPYNFADKFIDSDSDGIINSIEALLGSNPKTNDTDRDSFNDEFEFSVDLNPIYNDQLEDKDNDGINNIYEYKYGLNLLDPSDANKDLDNDGLTNLQEFKFGSYANKQDSDGDLLPDSVEYNYGLNPLIDDSYLDLDNDGMPNLWEYQNGLILNVNDSYLDLDNDGMPNIYEYIYKFDPQDAVDASLDADGDGYTNLEEYQMGTNPRDALDPPKQSTTTQISNSSYNIFNDQRVMTFVAIVTISGGIIGGTMLIYREYMRRKEEFRL